MLLLAQAITRCIRQFNTLYNVSEVQPKIIDTGITATNLELEEEDTTGYA